jgi:hypothetical protein
MKKWILFSLLTGLTITSSTFAATAFVKGQYCSWGIGFNHNNLARAIHDAYADCERDHCQQPKLASSVQGGGYSAIAIGSYRHHCQIGYAINQWRLDMAIQVALKTCREMGRGSCTIIKTWEKF